jgi:transcriptional regulator with XRE-family HTH domain
MDSPGKRIKWALEQRNMSAAELGRMLKLTRSAVSQWWAKDKPTSPMEHLRRVGEILHVSVHWLHTGEGNPWVGVDTEGAIGLPEGAIEVTGARVLGVAEGEVWREGKSLYDAFLAPANADDVMVPAMPRSDLAGVQQFAFEVRGNMASRTVQSGEFVICMRYSEARFGGPQEGDFVVVEKTRGDGTGHEHKIILGRLRFGRSGWEVVYESNDERWHGSIKLSTDLKQDTGDHTAVDVFGLVLGIFRRMNRPTYRPSPGIAP